MNSSLTPTSSPTDHPLNPNPTPPTQPNSDTNPHPRHPPNPTILTQYFMQPISVLKTRHSGDRTTNPPQGPQKQCQHSCKHRGGARVPKNCMGQKFWPLATATKRSTPPNKLKSNSKLHQKSTNFFCASCRARKPLFR